MADEDLRTTQRRGSPPWLADPHQSPATHPRAREPSFELWCARQSQGENLPFDLADLKSRLGEVDAAAPTVPRRLAEQVEHEPCEWIATAELLSPMAAPAIGSTEDPMAMAPRY